MPKSNQQLEALAYQIGHDLVELPQEDDAEFERAFNLVEVASQAALRVLLDGGDEPAARAAALKAVGRREP